MMHLEFPLQPPQGKKKNPIHEGKGRFDMYIVLVDRRLWTSGTVSGEGADPQDRNESDSNQQLEPKDKETSLDDNEEGELSKSSNAVIVWIFAIEVLYSKLFLKFSPHPTLHRLMHFSQTFQTPFFFYSPPNKPDNASDILHKVERSR